MSKVLDLNLAIRSVFMEKLILSILTAIMVYISEKNDN